MRIYLDIAPWLAEAVKLSDITPRSCPSVSAGSNGCRGTESHGRGFTVSDMVRL